MCETPKGDSFSFYAKTGASANAFTSYDRTCYLFSATQKIDENLDILLGMVGKPWFTKATIAKEQGIIGQEIKMYDDSPDWRLLNALFHCLYADHPLRDDIAGTVESIAGLTPADALQLHQGVLRAVRYGAVRGGQNHAGAGSRSLQAQRPVPRPRCP